jgi:energy-coupling factor transporter ATP-binding protein EcfA2
LDILATIRKAPTRNLTRNRPNALDDPFLYIENGGYLMITRLEISNFRCFETLTLTGLQRFNVIVGESGSGKTALLETLFLIASGGPESFFRLRKWRGFGDGGPLSLNGTRDSFEGLFRFLFHNERASSASIKSHDSNFGRRSLDIYFEDRGSLDVTFAAPENSMTIKPIHFKYKIGNRETNLSIEIKEGKISGFGIAAEVFPLHFISSKNTNSSFDAQLFSQISRRSETESLVKAVRDVFSFVEDLSLEIDGGEALIHARITGFKNKIPVNELSGGLNKFLSIAVAIASNSGGVVAVDEIENGFYFKDQEKVIRGLIHLCTLYDVQLFTSTHSWEFLQAFAPALEGRENDFCLIKSTYAEGISSMRVVGGASTLSALTQDIEIRN